MNFNIKEDGIQKVLNYMEEWEAKVKVGTVKGMKEVRKHIVERVKANAPKKTGELRDSINGQVKTARGEYELIIAADAPHALKVHEGVEPYGSGPKKVKNPESTPEGGTGGKFITRVVDHHTNLIKQTMIENISAALRDLDGSKTKTSLDFEN